MLGALGVAAVSAFVPIVYVLITVVKYGIFVGGEFSLKYIGRWCAYIAESLYTLLRLVSVMWCADTCRYHHVLRRSRI